MPVLNRIAGYSDDMKEWRRWIHQHPEVGLDCHQTAAFVVSKLREFGIEEIHEGIARTGVVAIIHGQGDGPTIGLRADMDALPMTEETGLSYASELPGRMHACGHDGHTAMLLGAARYLAETRRFRGRVALIFQPDEEGDGGGRVMVEEGIMERFEISRVFAVHNSPEAPFGHFSFCPGAMLAASDEFDVTVSGVGGHAAAPEQAVDPIPAALAMVSAFQTIVSRNHSAYDRLVISVTTIHAGTASNIIPSTCTFGGTVRSFDKSVQAMVIRRMEEIISGTAAAYGLKAELDFRQGYPATVNDAREAAFAAEVARDVVGPDAVTEDALPEMYAEDFAYMLDACPGAYLNLGQGPTAACHHPKFDFNDEIAPIGASFFARLVERAQPV
jgi:hippurate hydrolase